jgi:hypothetical protein
MITVLHAVELADWCFLSELLYWVALKRFPVEMYDSRGDEFRFSRDCELFAGATLEDVSYSECEFAGLPPNPRYSEQGVIADAKFLKQMAEYIDALSEVDRLDLVARRQEAIAQVKEIEDWDKDFMHFLEYYKSQLFLDLRDGKIIAQGINLKGSNVGELEETIEKNDLRLHQLEFLTIDQKHWLYSKIDWERNILYGADSSFCWVRFEVQALLSIYPLPALPAAGTVMKLCDAYILDSQVDKVPRETRRGRPSLPWDLFHLEVAVRAKEQRLPNKKEAAISEFADWFRDKHGIAVGRSSIGQKLTPYYRRIFRSDGENGLD